MLLQIMAQQLYTNFPVLMSHLSQSSISEVDFNTTISIFISIKSLKTVGEAFESR